jgi:hypothetical protein
MAVVVVVAVLAVVDVEAAAVVTARRSTVLAVHGSTLKWRNTF